MPWSSPTGSLGWLNSGWSSVAAGGGTYTAQGVNFDGTTTFLERGAALGVSNSQLGIMSFWFKMRGGDGNFQLFLEDASSGVTGLQILRLTDNTMRISAGGTSTTRFQGHTTATFTVGMGWAHLLCGWDLTVPQVQLFITDTSDYTPIVAVTSGVVDYSSTNWGIGDRVGGTILIDADVADFYVNTQQTLDFSVSANRRKFISAGLAPVDLGSDGSTPTGTAPSIFLHGSVSTWQTNDGTAGGFTKNGTLVAASTNPP